MGWTYTYKPAHQTTREFFEERFNASNGKTTWKVLDCAPKGSVAYLALEITTAEERRVVGLVCLIRRAKDRYNFGYKDMDETMGPYESECPKRILDLLTPLKPEEEWAAQWRQRCRDNLAKTKRPSLQAGDRIVFPSPVRFGDGAKLTSAYLVDPKRATLATSKNGFAAYRLTRRFLQTEKYDVFRGTQQIIAA